ncbi:hypothetical protein TRFO_37154 [Tritrichomonas foetus]|uniref:Uncharacterized protein n=1 Tax=Tritrichomonas foetus TaxID=1144522 RepID=A0A1J4JBR0_9EUKA|nr:hypothetical protein TRFO_37154 [Tritrichomonas foetus]|eukprot:OHS96634.1 hypothetical protein TRFO_37154 [Tritrichomonas foetus]
MSSDSENQSNASEEEEINEPVDIIPQFDALKIDPKKNIFLSINKKVIAVHVQVMFSDLNLDDNLFAIFQGESHVTLDTYLSQVDPHFFKEIEVFRQSMENIAKSLKKWNNPVLSQYYITFLKSHLMFMGFCHDFGAVNVLFHFFSKLNKTDPEKRWVNNFFSKTNVDGVQKTFEAIKDTYCCLVGMFINNIGTGFFMDYSKDNIPNEILKVTEVLGIDQNLNLVQRTATRNGLLKFKPNENHYKKGSKTFKKPFIRYDFKKFQDIFELMTGNEDSKSIFQVIDNVINECDKTPINYFYKIVHDTKNLYIEMDESDDDNDDDYDDEDSKDFTDNIFVSSPPLPHEQLIIQQYARFDLIPAETNNNAAYFQLYSANFKGKNPAYSKPEKFIHELFSDVLNVSSTLPKDFLIRGTCYTPNYYHIEVDNEVDDEDDDQCLYYSYYLDVNDMMHPLEANLMRIFEFGAFYSTIENNKENLPKVFELEMQGCNKQRDFFKKQIQNIVKIIGMILFPDAPSKVTQPVSNLFIMSVFGQLYKLLIASNNLDEIENFNVGEIRYAFSMAMMGIIPSVYQNLFKLADMTQESTAEKLEFNEPEGNDHRVVYPLSFRIMLTHFLVDPGLRIRCPVIYNYLRLSPRFNAIKFIPIIAPVLYQIWEKRDEVADNPKMSFKDFSLTKSEFKAFVDHWGRAINFLNYGVLPNKTRNRLNKTNGVKSHKLLLRYFLPYEPGNWPALHVLQSLSEPHNEFISTLQKYKKIHCTEINDNEISENLPFNIDSSAYNQFLVRIIRDRLGPNGIPTFDEKAEQLFINNLSQCNFYMVFHPLLNSGGTVKSDDTTKSLIEHFESQLASIPITDDQKKQLFIHVKLPNKSAGLMLLIEKLMKIVLDLVKEAGFPIYHRTTFSEFKVSLSEQKRTKCFFDQLSQIEKDGFAAFNIAKGRAKDDFKVGQFAKIYSYLSEPVDKAKLAQTCQDAIVQKFMERAKIAETDVAPTPLEGVTNCRPFFTIIPKIFADLINEDKVDQRLKERSPSYVISEWEKLDEKKRMLVDCEEKEAINIIKSWDTKNSKNESPLLIAYFNEAKTNYIW